jgi:RimJ/RimL family protein N-acetyltransferase
MLIGKNVKIRPMENRDFEQFYQWMGNQDSIGKQINVTMLYKEVYFENLGAMLKDATSLYCIVEDLESNPIGMVEYHPVYASTIAVEFGILIAEKNAKKKGYGRECAKLFIDHIFRTKEIMRVQVLVNSKNNLAKNTATKSGFKFEGTLKQYAFVQGEYADFNIMAITREEWIKINS